MKNRAKTSKVRSIRPYEGKWVDGDFVIVRPLQRTDLTSPELKPSFLVILDSGERILIEVQRQFYIKEFTTKRVGTADQHTLKVIRMRGPRWRKISAAIKKGMRSWFQGFDYWGMSIFDEFTLPLIRQAWPKLIDNDLIGVQPMKAPSGLFFIKGTLKS